MVPLAELEAHASAESLWIAVGGYVFDVTELFASTESSSGGQRLRHRRSLGR